MVKIKLIVAIDKNGIMGVDGKLPWKLSDDLKHFKTETSNSVIIMGKKTFDSLPGILPDREHIVLSKSLKESNDKVSVFSSINTLIEYLNANYDTVYIIGGANTVHQFIRFNLLDELIITHVDASVKGDSQLNMNLIDIDSWSMYESIDFKKSDKNDHDFTIKKYIKKQKRF